MLLKFVTSRLARQIVQKGFGKTCFAENSVVAAATERSSIAFISGQQSRLVQSFTRHLSTSQPKLQNEEVEVTFVRANGDRIQAKGKVGDSLLDVVVNNQIDLDGFGACEGTLTCSTCHLIFSKADYDALPEKPGDEELDMLDLAFELTETSRLGCQITLTKQLNGLEVRVPATINDARS